MWREGYTWASSNQPSQPPMDEQDIDRISLGSDFQPPLASNKKKDPTHFQEERLPSGDNRAFQFASQRPVNERLDPASRYGCRSVHTTNGCWVCPKR